DQPDAAAWRWRRAEDVHAERATYRGALNWAVIGKVGHGHGAGERRLVSLRDDPRRGGPGVERRRTLPSQPAKEIGVRLVHQPVARAEQGAVRPGEVGDHVGRRILGLMRVDHPVETGADDETLPGRALGIAEEGAPRQFAMLV